MDNNVNPWRKSTYSSPEENCVEVAATSQGVATVRDTQDRGGPQLAFVSRDWDRFLARVRATVA
jgi:hypothetical protein